jgi:integrase/recombinase XerD
MMIDIHGGKRKDRMAPLSKLLLETLRDYVRQYRPVRYLFEGGQPATPYSNRTGQEILRQAKERAGIRKSGSIHSLRHSMPHTSWNRARISGTFNPSWAIKAWLRR